MIILIGYILNVIAFWFLNEGKDESGLGIGRKIMFFIRPIRAKTKSL